MGSNPGKESALFVLGAIFVIAVWLVILGAVIGKLSSALPWLVMVCCLLWYTSKTFKPKSDNDEK